MALADGIDGVVIVGYLMFAVLLGIILYYIIMDIICYSKKKKEKKEGTELQKEGTELQKEGTELQDASGSITSEYARAANLI